MNWLLGAAATAQAPDDARIGVAEGFGNAFLSVIVLFEAFRLGFLRLFRRVRGGGRQAEARRNRVADDRDVRKVRKGLFAVEVFMLDF